MIQGGHEYLGQILGVLFVFFRVGAFWFLFPLFSERSVPANIRLLTGLGLSIAVYGLVKNSLPVLDMTRLPSDFDLITMVASEVGLGIVMGLIARGAFFAVLAAAEWMSIQIGFSVGQLVDPSTGEGGEGWIELHRWMAVMLFLAIGGQYLLLQAVIDSYQFQFGSFLSTALLNKTQGLFWMDFGQTVLVWVLKLSGPIVLVTLLIQIAFGVLSKFIPQINIWSVSIPVTIGIGVFAFAVMSPFYGDVLGDIVGSSIQNLHNWMKISGAR